jgi:hypothetical protein
MDRCTPGRRRPSATPLAVRHFPVAAHRAFTQPADRAALRTLAHRRVLVILGTSLPVRATRSSVGTADMTDIVDVLDPVNDFGSDPGTVPPRAIPAVDPASLWDFESADSPAGRWSAGFTPGAVTLLRAARASELRAEPQSARHRTCVGAGQTAR